MGTVYLCEHAVLQRRFALKILRADLAGDPELVERFRNEAIAASRIGQENVVDVVDFGAEEDGAHYYVMEALEGQSLGSLLRDAAPLPVARTLALLEQICRALGAAHARGVVHRDVKPENVFVVPREGGGERAKVLDFGISHVPAAPGCERLTRAGSIIGTPEYMAPEQATGGAVDHRADVYAVGVLAFEMLTGTLPFQGASEVATLLAAQTDPPEPPSHRNSAVSPEVDALVLRALAKRPEDRHPSMTAFAVEIGRLRAALATASGIRHAIATARFDAPGPSRVPWRSRRGAGRSCGETVALTGSEVRPRTPRRATLALVGAAVALGIAAIGGWWLRGEGTRAATPVSIASATPTPTPAPAPTPTATPALEPDAAPVAVPDPRSPGPLRVRARAKPDDVKDPYAADGKDLKPDPFR